MDKQGCNQTTEYNLGLKRNVLSSHERTWMNNIPNITFSCFIHPLTDA